MRSPTIHYSGYPSPVRAEHTACRIPSHLRFNDARYPATSNPTQVTCGRCRGMAERMIAIGVVAPPVEPSAGGVK